MATRGRKSAASLKSVALSKIADNRLPPPEDLDGAPRELWLVITASLPADYFRPGDEPLLATYCRAYYLHRKAYDLIETGGITLIDDKGREYANPAAQMLNTQGSVMAQMAGKLRLCPSSRYTTKSASTKTDNAGVAKKPWAS